MKDSSTCTFFLLFIYFLTMFVFSQFSHCLNIKVIRVFISSLSDMLMLRNMLNPVLSFLFRKYWELGWKRSKAKKRREYLRVTEAHNGTVTMVASILFLPSCEVNHRNEEMNSHKRAGLLCNVHENNDCAIGIWVYLLFSLLLLWSCFLFNHQVRRAKTLQEMCTECMSNNC